MQNAFLYVSYLELFTVTFLLGLGGAISPGALLTYTIFCAIKKKKKAFSVGIKISLGHASIEIFLILLLLVGLVNWMDNRIILIVIGIFGGILLICFGMIILANIINRKVDTTFLESNTSIENKDFQNNKNSKPYLASMGFLMSNPYWWLWWITIGVSIMVDNGVIWGNWISLIIFIFAKELGAILWYTGIATAVGIAHKLMKKNVYLAILGICGLFMVIYGFYLGISPFFNL